MGYLNKSIWKRENLLVVNVVNIKHLKMLWKHINTDILVISQIYYNGYFYYNVKYQGIKYWATPTLVIHFTNQFESFFIHGLPRFSYYKYNNLFDLPLNCQQYLYLDNLSSNPWATELNIHTISECHPL